MGHHGQQGFAQGDAPGQGFRQRGIAHQPQIQRALAQGDNQLAGVALHRLHMHIGIALAVEGEGIGEGFDKGHRGGHADAQLARLPQMQPLRPFGRQIDLLHYLSGIAEKLGAGGGQADTAVGSGQQAGAYLLFQVLDLLAQWRLGDIKPCRGASEVQLLGHGNKVTQVTQLDIHIYKVLIKIINILDEILPTFYPDNRTCLFTL